MVSVIRQSTTNSEEEISDRSDEERDASDIFASPVPETVICQRATYL